MQERKEQFASPFTLKVFDGNEILQSDQRKNGIIIPKDSNVLLRAIFKLSGKTTDFEQDFGVVRLDKPFEGRLHGKWENPSLTVPEEITIFRMVPDSEKRRTITKGYGPELEAVNKQLAQDFFANRDEPELYNFDPADLMSLRLHIAVKEK